jgi:hypothetical protein
MDEMDCHPVCAVQGGMPMDSIDYMSLKEADLDAPFPPGEDG